jgi:hypothetical protein
VQQNVYAHLFRHSLATHLLEDWRTIVDVKQKLRHSNIVVTSGYVHSNPETVKKKSQFLWDDLLQHISSEEFSTGSLFTVMHSLVLSLLTKNDIINNW